MLLEREREGREGGGGRGGGREGGREGGRGEGGEGGGRREELRRLLSECWYDVHFPDDDLEDSM